MSGASVLAGVASRVSSVASAVNGAEKGSDSAGEPFAGMLKSMVAETNELDRKAAETVTGLLSGQGVEIHEAMIATQKADMAFQLALEVRNKAVGAYQQMLNMQF